MSGEDLWGKIEAAITKNPIDVKTVPSNKKEPLWFKAYIVNDKLYVDNSYTRKPSTKMSKSRPIRKEEFIKVYEYYHRWAKGERHLKQEAIELSRNTAYIFGLIAHFE
ncbi:hypothetical protein GGQ84_002728 [Desulfitispora alkaliphila]|uniref:hypothetical protein n=1 Tax=Desulfitispora alkaliphila TaxID=622674 RepID=UPI003D1A1FED